MTYTYETTNGKTTRITLDENGVEILREFVPASENTALAGIKATAQSAAGVALGALTAAQVRSLLAILLYKAGGVDISNPSTPKVKPLNQWL